MYSTLFVGFGAFAAILGGAFVGVQAKDHLPRHNLSEETKNLASVSTAVVATVSALVLGLLISNANTRFTQVAPDGAKPARGRPHRLLVYMEKLVVPSEKGNAARLFQRRIDVGKFGVHGAAKAVDDGDDGQRNAGCDQAVLDCGSPGFVGQETRKRAFQLCLRLERTEGFEPRPPSR